MVMVWLRPIDNQNNLQINPNQERYKIAVKKYPYVKEVNYFNLPLDRLPLQKYPKEIRLFNLITLNGYLLYQHMILID
jgi:hypothetical protein